MPLSATVTMKDSLNRKTSKRYECEATTLAQAQTDVGALITDLEAVSDLGVVEVTYTLKDEAEASAPADPSSIDAGATFRVRLSDGYEAAMKIPGFPQSKAIAGGAIPVDDTDVVAYFANFAPGGAFTANRGQTVSEVLSGMFDK